MNEKDIYNETGISVGEEQSSNVNSSMHRTIGINLGEEYSTISCLEYIKQDDGKMESINFFDSLFSYANEYTTNQIAFNGEEYICGWDADSSAYKSSVKKIFFDEGSQEVLIDRFFHYLHKACIDSISLNSSFKNCGQISENTLISINASCNDNLIKIIVEAAKKADFEKVQTCMEPIAAIQSFFTEKKDTKNEWIEDSHMNILFVHLEYESFRTAVIDMTMHTNPIYKVLYKSSPLEFSEIRYSLIDELLYEFFAYTFLRFNVNLDNVFNDPDCKKVSKESFKMDISKWQKIYLKPLWTSRNMDAKMEKLPDTVGYLCQIFDLNEKSFIFDKNTFEAIITDYLNKIRAALEMSVNKCELTFADIDLVLGIGESSGWYFIEDTLSHCAKTVKISDESCVISRGLCSMELPIMVRNRNRNDVWLTLVVPEKKTYAMKITKDLGRVLPCMSYYEHSLEISTVELDELIIGVIAKVGSSVETSVKQSGTIIKLKKDSFFDNLLGTSRTFGRNYTTNLTVKVLNYFAKDGQWSAHLVIVNNQDGRQNIGSLNRNPISIDDFYRILEQIGVR